MPHPSPFFAPVCSRACWLEDCDRAVPHRLIRDRYEYSESDIQHCLKWWVMLQAGRLPPKNEDKDRLPDTRRSHPAFGPRPPGGAVTELRADLDSALVRLAQEAPDLYLVAIAFTEAQNVGRAARFVGRRKETVGREFHEAVRFLVQVLNGER